MPSLQNYGKQNIQVCFKPSSNTAIDEHLFLTETRCQFMLYMPNKPDKFGLKCCPESDLRREYFINSFRGMGQGCNPKIKHFLEQNFSS